MQGRRDFIKLLAGATATAGIALSTAARAASLTEIRRLQFENLHTGERLDAAYWEKGSYQSDVLRAVNVVLRDFRTGDVHPIEPQLLDLLHVLQSATGTQRAYQVISGYRSPKTNAMLASESAGVAHHSLHMEGKAIDIRLADVSLADLHATALRLGQGGVGYYPRSDFVHVDIGRVRQWGGTGA